MTELTKYNTDCNNTIQQHKEGKDVLSWIEKFCIHLLNEKDKLHLFFKEAGEHVLFFRITELESQGFISGYYCYFKKNRFCVNKSVGLPAKELRELLGSNGANWESEATRKWWEMVFINGDVAHVDVDTLKRKEVKASEQLNTNMQEFINSIQEELGKAAKLMNDPQKPPQLDLTKISKVFVVGEYTSALLPLNYALKEMLKSEVLSISESNYNYTWQNSANCFLAPRTLLDTELNTSAQITISDVINMGKTGIVITVPLMKEDDEKYSLPSTPIFNGCNLIWNELMKGEVQYDYKAGDFLFKRVHLSMIVDGFQTIYVKCDSAVVACSVYKKGKHIIKGLLPKKSEEEQKPTIPKTIQSKKSNGVESDTEGMQPNPSLDEDPQTLSTLTSDIKDVPNNEAKNAIDDDNSEILKKGVLNREIQEALTIIMALLRKKAYLFIQKYFPNDTAGNLYDIWINSERKNGEKYPSDLKKNWKKFKKTEALKAKNRGSIYDWKSYSDPNRPESNTRMLDWGNYYVFLGCNWEKLGQEWKANIKSIEENIYKIGKLTRNDSSHQYVDDMSKDNLLNMLGYMIDIAQKLKAQDIEETVTCVRTNVIKLLY